MSTRGGEGGGPVRQKRGRGRPPVPMGRQITPKVAKPRMTSGDESDHVYSATEGNLTDAEVSDMRYRRMRDLNNEASKRCRENRKLKNELLEAEFEIQRDRNVELRARLTRLENRVRQIKTLYLQHIASGQNADLPDITQPWTPKDFQNKRLDDLIEDYLFEHRSNTSARKIEEYPGEEQKLVFYPTQPGKVIRTNMPCEKENLFVKTLKKGDVNYFCPFLKLFSCMICTIYILTIQHKILKNSA